jgi:serine/threonine-protein kinase
VLFDRWVLGAPLGEGGTARVWRAQDRARGHDVAVKLLAHGDDAAAVRRLLREGEALSRVAHPGVVRVLDVVAGPPAMLVLELVDAPSLRVLLHEQLLPVDDVLRLAVDVAAALSAAHAAGVAHRDLKPENILVRQGRAVVVDFGLAAPVSPSSATEALSTTTTTSIHGTPAYLAPELVEAGADVDAAAADRYALGVVLLECLLGDNPYRAPTVAQTLARHVEKSPPHPSSARAPGEVGDAFAAVVVALLSRRPSSRPSLDDVIAAARGERPAGRASPPSSSPPPPSPPTSLPPPSPSPTSIASPHMRTRPRATLVGAAAAALIILGTWSAVTSTTTAALPLVAAPASSVTPPSSSLVTPPAASSVTPSSPLSPSSPPSSSAAPTRVSDAAPRLHAGRGAAAPAADAGVIVDAAVVDAGDLAAAAPVGLPAKRRTLRERCGRLSCAALGDQTIPTDLVALRRYRDDVDACLVRCR